MINLFDNDNSIDVDDYHYGHDEPELKARTKKRLQQIVDMGMVETGIASFGVKGVVSGLYIEKVWGHSDEKWDDHIEWMQSLIDKKS